VRQTRYDSGLLPVQTDSRLYYSLDYVYNCVYTDVCVRVPDNTRNIDSCKFVRKESHYHMVLM